MLLCYTVTNTLGNLFFFFFFLTPFITQLPQTRVIIQCKACKNNNKANIIQINPFLNTFIASLSLEQVHMSIPHPCYWLLNVSFTVITNHLLLLSVYSGC